LNSAEYTGVYLVSVSEDIAVEFGRFEEQVSTSVCSYRVMHVNSPWLGVVVKSSTLLGWM